MIVLVNVFRFGLTEHASALAGLTIVEPSEGSLR
jgi:hypothetical protein